MKKCAKCDVTMKQLSSKTPEGVPSTYFKCEKCNEELLSMDQLHEVADAYRVLKRYHLKLSKWGESLGLRIPKELVSKYKFRKEVTIIPEEKGIRIVPE